MNIAKARIMQLLQAQGKNEQADEASEPFSSCVELVIDQDKDGFGDLACPAGAAA